MVKMIYARIERKGLDDSGAFTGLASTFGNVDLSGDVVVAGAFARSIEKSGGRVKLLLQHNPARPIGIARVWESSAGLHVEGKLSLGTADGRETYALMRDGVLDALSIGYNVSKSTKRKDGTRELRELDLVEISIVTFPANTLATIGAVKAGGSVAQQLRQLLRDARQTVRDAADRALARDLGKVSGGLRRLAERVRS